ncbi:uncharacterized protein LOC379589 isoform X1 [Xenopus laevis]|uniref:Uncharacterized protein LOC379589 isoform X1 n=2 Tax=Xenopus laevis TaxID=8355 RepID=A0A1L8ER54_XENLA|nr:uncharacterized protein LOC379589 isoform X1 [Xenopus laevis]OCT61790.1 hypothetical protein XELAEV_18047819mg [Xenopus laevis]
MASARLRQELCCSICLDFYRKPVILRCGHNFCQDCITGVFDTQEEEEWGFYTCPECRKRFKVRPLPVRNLALYNIAELYKVARPKPEETEILCTYCIDFPQHAVKTCLHCEASLCEVHLRAHCTSEEHILLDPTSPLQNRHCPIHGKLFEYYCSEDSVCVCVHCCLSEQHRGHQVEMLNKASQIRKAELSVILENMGLLKAKKNMATLNLTRHGRKVEQETAVLTKNVAALFSTIREHLGCLEHHILNEIKLQEQKVLLPISELIGKLEVEKDELTRKMHYIEELCHNTDSLAVLQDQELDNVRDDDDDEEETYSKHLISTSHVDRLLLSLIIQKGLDRYVATIPKLTADRWSNVECVSDLLLDDNTSGNNICLSGDLKMATYSTEAQERGANSCRFQTGQVMSTTSFSSGKHFWEVEVSEDGLRSVGVAYSSIPRAGQESIIGYNSQSWSLTWINHLIGVSHNSEGKTVSKSSTMRNVGIYLDYEAGVLTFYQLCNPIRHLYTFTCVFTEPLHLAFRVENGWVRISSKPFWTIASTTESKVGDL